MRIISIVGARPQFIKLAPLTKKLRRYHNEKIIHTGQHFDQNMSDFFFKDLSLPTPDFHIGISTGSHAQQTANILFETEKYLIKEKPDVIIVFGDTNTTLAGSLAASKLHIPIIHIEAGLRSFNKKMPEEINRVVTDHISDYLFAPTKTAVKNLKEEGLYKKTFLTGDVMVESIKMIFKKAARNIRIIDTLDLRAKDFSLLTLHRPYNVDDPLRLSFLLKNLNQLDQPTIFPIHPRTRKSLNAIEGDYKSLYRNISFIEPLGYLDFITLQSKANRIITDSGGMQKEAYILKKPCITLRTETEWVETVESGWNLLLSAEEDSFIERITNFSPPKDYQNLFGENVAEKMVELINTIKK